MPVRFVRRAAWFAGGVLILLMLGSLAVSLIAGRTLVQAGIVQNLGELTGRRITLDGDIRIRVFPRLEAELNAVRINDWATPSADAALFRAEKVTLALSATDALRGIITIEKTRLVRPVLDVPFRDGAIAFQQGGALHAAVVKARRQLDADPEETAFAAARGNGIGPVTIIDGEIGLAAPEDRITAINGTATWGKASDRFALDLSAIWHGEPVAVRASVADMLHLLAGRPTETAVALTSEPASLSLDGTATLKPSLFVDGEGTIQLASVRRVADWTGIALPMTGMGGAIRVEGLVRGSALSLSIEDAVVALGTTTGRGAVSLVRETDTTTMSGSLALDQLDLAALSALVAPIDLGTGREQQDDAARNAPLALDLRLSATRARFGTFTFSDVAASLQQRNHITSFDINNAAIEGGSLQLAVRSGEGVARETEFRLLLEDIDGAALGVARPEYWLLPSARLTLSMILRGEGRTFDELLANADGSLTMRSGSGRLNGFTLASLVGQVRQGAFFQFKPVPGMSMPLKVLEAEAAIENGALRFSKAVVSSDDDAELRMRGLASLASRDLALAGTITLAPGSPLRAQGATPADQPESLSFFVGGSADNVFISPVMERPPFAADVP